MPMLAVMVSEWPSSRKGALRSVSSRRQICSRIGWLREILQREDKLIAALARKCVIAPGWTAAAARRPALRKHLQVYVPGRR